MAYDDRETGLTVEDRGSKLGLPQNQDAEANVLAAMLLSPEVVEEAQVELQPDWSPLPCRGSWDAPDWQWAKG